MFLTCFDTATFLQNLVVKCQRYHVFPAKMTLVCVRSLLLYEKISYSFSSSSENLKVCNVSRLQAVVGHTLLTAEWRLALDKLGRLLET